MINSLVKRIAAHFLSQADLKSLVNEDSAKVKHSSAVAYITTILSKSEKGSLEYKELNRMANDFVVKSHDANSFAQMCRSYVRDNSAPDYYLVAAIGNVIVAHQMETGTLAKVPGGEAGKLNIAIKQTLNEAKDVKNYIKRRALVNNAVKAELPGIDAGRSATITELLLQLA